MQVCGIPEPRPSLGAPKSLAGWHIYASTDGNWWQLSLAETRKDLKSVSIWSGQKPVSTMNICITLNGNANQVINKFILPLYDYLAHIWTRLWGIAFVNGMWNTRLETIPKLTALCSPALGGGINPWAFAATTHRHKVPHSANETFMTHFWLKNPIYIQASW